MWVLLAIATVMILAPLGLAAKVCPSERRFCVLRIAAVAEHSPKVEGRSVMTTLVGAPVRSLGVIH